MFWTVTTGVRKFFLWEFGTPVQKFYEHPSIAVPNIPIFSFRTPDSFFYEHPLKYPVPNIEMCVSLQFRTSVKNLYEHPCFFR